MVNRYSLVHQRSRLESHCMSRSRSMQQCHVVAAPSQRWVAESESYAEEPDVPVLALPPADDQGRHRSPDPSVRWR